MPPADIKSRSSLAKPGRRLPHFVAQRHHELEAAFQDILREHGVNPHALAARWDELDAALRDHMAAEEELILPDFQLTAPEEGDALRTEHAQIRELLTAIGHDVQHHQIHTARLHQLVSLLHAHARREDAALYPWAEDSLPRPVRRQLLLRIGHWLRRLSAQRL